MATLVQVETSSQWTRDTSSLKDVMTWGARGETVRIDEAWEDGPYRGEK